jgi:hypothetical protein
MDRDVDTVWSCVLAIDVGMRHGKFTFHVISVVWFSFWFRVFFCFCVILFARLTNDDMAISYPFNHRTQTRDIVFIKAAATLACVGFVGLWAMQIWKVVVGV